MLQLSWSEHHTDRVKQQLILPLNCLSFIFLRKNALSISYIFTLLRRDIFHDIRIEPCNAHVFRNSQLNCHEFRILRFNYIMMQELIFIDSGFGIYYIRNFGRDPLLHTLFLDITFSPWCIFRLIPCKTSSVPALYLILKSVKIISP